MSAASPRRLAALPQHALLLLVTLAGAGCGHSAAERRTLALPAVTALQGGEFARAEQLASSVLADDGGNAQAAAVAAISRFQRTSHQLVTDARGLFTMLDESLADHRYARFALQSAVEELDVVDRALAAAAGDPGVSLELCLACWKHDWNRSGEVDERDERLLQIELDADGNELPDGDPRRTPTFRFDVGDVHWARAFVAFERAVLELLLAYDWSGLTAATLRPVLEGRQPLSIPLADRVKFARVSALLRFGLDEADAARLAYLGETDDDREWVPSPSQKSHPLPLPVDAALYETWAGVISDLRAMLERQEGLSVAELAQLGRRQWDKPPGGFLDLGGLLAEPRAIRLDLSALRDKRDDRADDVEAVLSALLGDRFTRAMVPSKLVSRLRRMREEMERGTESWGRKLRYLFWLN